MAEGKPQSTTHPKTVVIGGKRWRLVFEILRDCDGLCDPPTKHGKTIHIHRPLLRRPQLLLETVIHEVLHARGWPLSEEFVTEAAEDIARILWKLGFRYTTEGE